MGRRLVAAIDFLCVTLLGNGALTERKKKCNWPKNQNQIGKCNKVILMPILIILIEIFANTHWVLIGTKMYLFALYPIRIANDSLIYK